MMYLVHVWNDDRDWSKIIGYMFYCILNIAIVLHAHFCKVLYLCFMFYVFDIEGFLVDWLCS